MDRLKYRETRKGDAKFIKGVTKEYGSREIASRVWVEQGFRFYLNDKLGMAMRRFNQAWLLNPNNPEVYVGFAAVLHDQGQVCKSMGFSNKALTMSPPTNQGIYPDAGRIVTLCAINDKSFTESDKMSMFKQSENLFKKAEKIEPNKEYVYATWASAYYWRGEYENAWKMVAKQRALGGEPNSKFLKLLSSKLVKPSIN
jgi:tetratricopeptide (TPR) repeat protein